jgi:energy-coupling factor transporter ATP-binding protein EcfA2
MKSDYPIKILHLSDIRLGSEELPDILFSQLAADLDLNLKVSKIDYLVISGDAGSTSNEQEYDAVFKLISKLSKKYEIDFTNIIIVPGNHDVNWDVSEESYKFFFRRKLDGSISEDRCIDCAGAGKLVRNDEAYKDRFRFFSDFLYYRIHNRAYPRDYDQQALLYTFSEHKLLFLGLNSCWEIDHHYRNRSSINPEAFSNAIKNFSLGQYSDWLKFAVWHHPATGAESLKDTSFLEELSRYGFRIAFHGHVHEDKNEAFHYGSNEGLRIIAAGTFGTQVNDKIKKTPFQYNLISLCFDAKQLTVESRKKKESHGSWRADTRWGDINNPSSSYSIAFASSKAVDSVRHENSTRRSLPTIFVSYSDSDIKLATLDYFIGRLKRELAKLNARFRIYSKYRLDHANDTSLEDTISKCDAVIVLGSPGYRAQINDKFGIAYQEYKLICGRAYRIKIDQSEYANTQQVIFKVIPVIIKGSLKASLPVEFGERQRVEFTETQRVQFIETQRVFDLSDIRLDTLSKNDSIFTSSKDNKKFEARLASIAQIITSTLITNSLPFKKAEADINERFKTSNDLFGQLFKDTKFSSSTVEKVPPFFDKLFVSTPDFEEVIQQRAYFMIGRKGSGKSTLTGALALNSNEKYKGYIAVSAESINLNYLYDSMTSQTNADRRYVLSKYIFFQVAWDGFIALCLTKLIVELMDRDVLGKTQVHHANEIYAFYKTFMTGEMERIVDDLELQTFIFETSFDKAQAFLKSLIDDAPAPNNLATDIRSLAQSRFNTNQFLTYLFGFNAHSALINIISGCDKRVLVTVDNFDTKFDLLRRDARNDGIELKKRNDFELEWLHGVMLRILDLKDLNKAKGTPFNSMDFCLTIPKDRFIQIEKEDRDDYRLNNRTKSIQWSGLDLCKILIQRLCYLTGSNANSDLPLHKQLDQLIDANFPNLPLNLHVSYGDKQLEMPLFCYVLRNSFWRPRDVLKIFEQLLAVSKIYSGQADKLPFGVIKSIVHDAAYSIIKTDFINEYISTIPTIKFIVNSFTGMSEVLSANALYEHLLSRDYFFIVLSDDYRVPVRSAKDFNFRKQVELLFDIGFLGVAFLPNVSSIYMNQMSGEFPDHFYFNEGSRAFHRIADNDFKESMFIIHPMFWDYLTLKSWDSYYPLHFTWEYLYTNGAMQPFRP